MSKAGETFFYRCWLYDGRIQEPIVEFGRRRFGAEYPDTITEAGLVGLLAKDPIDERLIDSLKKKILISLEKHKSKGILVHGHQECAGNPVEDERQKDDIRKSVKVLQNLINFSVPVVGVFVKRSESNPDVWQVEDIPPTVTV